METIEIPVTLVYRITEDVYLQDQLVASANTVLNRVAGLSSTILTLLNGAFSAISDALVIADVTPDGGPKWLMNILGRNLEQPDEIKFYFSNAPATIPLPDLVRLSGMRWPIETIFEEGKGKIGFDHYETRSWLGWHHHMLLGYLADFDRGID